MAIEIALVIYYQKARDVGHGRGRGRSCLQFFEELIDVRSRADDPVDLVELIKWKYFRIQGIVLEKKSCTNPGEPWLTSNKLYYNSRQHRIPPTTAHYSHIMIMTDMLKAL